MLFETLIIFSATTISAVINWVIFDCLYEELQDIQNKEIKIFIEGHNNTNSPYNKDNITNSLDRGAFILEKKDNNIINIKNDYF
tara:strand:- start:1156 stop:1407 length:252 start_codon:yes stop_codon:yes gene_type:complete